MRRRTALTALVTLIAVPAALAQAPLSTAFTYQGRLEDGANPANAAYDFTFRLFDAAVAGVPIGALVAVNDMAVSDGLFTAQLDFGASPFSGDARWLEIAVRPGESSGAYTTLTPRQPLTATPYALYALNSPTSGGGPWGVSGTNIFNTNTGDVGIGTSSPTRILHTVGDAVLFERSVNDAAVILRNTLNGTLNASFGLHNTGPSDGYSYLSDQTQTPLLHLRSGNVGIGHTNPAAKLAINGPVSTGAGTGCLVLTNPGFPIGNTLAMDGDSIDGWGNLQLNPIAPTDIRMAEGGGNVGIGVAAPAYRLDVNGRMQVRQGSTASAGIYFHQNTPNNERGFIGMRNDTQMGLYGTQGAGWGLLMDVVNGRVGINTTAPATDFHVNGTARVNVLEIVGADVAEKFPVSEEVRPGMVVMIDAQNAGKLCLSKGAYNKRVAGIVSGANGLAAGTILGHLPGNEDAPPIALSGRVWVHCDATEHAIEIGDMLTTSNTPGHAMSATDSARIAGAVIGKAMTALPQGETGMVLVLVNLQ